MSRQLDTSRSRYRFLVWAAVACQLATLLVAVAIFIVSAVELLRYGNYYRVFPEPSRGVWTATRFMFVCAGGALAVPVFYTILLCIFPYYSCERRYELRKLELVHEGGVDSCESFATQQDSSRSGSPRSTHMPIARRQSEEEGVASASPEETGGRQRLHKKDVLLANQQREVGTDVRGAAATAIDVDADVDAAGSLSSPPPRLVHPQRARRQRRSFAQLLRFKGLFRPVSVPVACEPDPFPLSDTSQRHHDGVSRRPSTRSPTSGTANGSRSESEQTRCLSDTRAEPKHQGLRPGGEGRDVRESWRGSGTLANPLDHWDGTATEHKGKSEECKPAGEEEVVRGEVFSPSQVVSPATDTLPAVTTDSFTLIASTDAAAHQHSNKEVVARACPEACAIGEDGCCSSVIVDPRRGRGNPNLGNSSGCEVPMHERVAGAAAGGQPQPDCEAHHAPPRLLDPSCQATPPSSQHQQQQQRLHPAGTNTTASLSVYTTPMPASATAAWASALSPSPPPPALSLTNPRDWAGNHHFHFLLYPGREYTEAERRAADLAAAAQAERDSRRPPAYTMQLTKLEVDGRHLRVVRCTYYIINLVALLLIFFFGLFGALATSFSTLTETTTMEEGWERIFYQTGAPPTARAATRITRGQSNGFGLYRYTTTSVDDGNAAGQTLSRPGSLSEFYLTPEVNTEVCRLQLSGHCSGGPRLCSKPSYTSSVEAFSAFCPYCPDEQDRIAAFTTRCAAHYYLSDAYPIAFFALASGAVLCVLLDLIATVAQCAHDIVPILRYEEYIVAHMVYGDLAGARARRQARRHQREEQRRQRCGEGDGAEEQHRLRQTAAGDLGAAHLTDWAKATSTAVTTTTGSYAPARGSQTHTTATGSSILTTPAPRVPREPHLSSSNCCGRRQQQGRPLPASSPAPLSPNNQGSTEHLHPHNCSNNRGHSHRPLPYPQREEEEDDQCSPLLWGGGGVASRADERRGQPGEDDQRLVVAGPGEGHPLYAPMESSSSSGLSAFVDVEGDGAAAPTTGN